MKICRKLRKINKLNNFIKKKVSYQDLGLDETMSQGNPRRTWTKTKTPMLQEKKKDRTIQNKERDVPERQRTELSKLDSQT